MSNELNDARPHQDWAEVAQPVWYGKPKASPLAGEPSELQDLTDDLTDELKNLFNGSFVDPTRLNREQVDELVRGSFEIADRCLSIVCKMRREIRRSGETHAR